MVIFTNSARSSVIFALQPKDRIFDVANAVETALTLGTHVMFSLTGSTAVDSFLGRIKGAALLDGPFDNRVYKTQLDWANSND